MPDVGVLNLQIHDNSEAAVSGLESLVTALERIRNAVSAGLKLSSIATGMKNIGKTVDDYIHGSTITKIGQLADELSKLKGLGNLNIKINGGSSVESIRDAVAAAQTSVNATNAGFDEMENRGFGAKEAIDAMADSVRGMSDATRKLDFSKFDVDNLPKGMLGATVREAEQQWGQYKQQVIDADQIVNRVEKSTNAIIPYTENLENTWERICEREREAARIAKEQYAKMAEEAMRKAQELNGQMATKYRSFPSRTLEDYYFGMRYGRTDAGTDYKRVQQNDLMSRWLHGEGTQKEQNYAFKTMAQEFGMTVDEVRAKVEALKEMEREVLGVVPASGASESIKETGRFAERITAAFERLKDVAKSAFGALKGNVLQLHGSLQRMFPTLSGLMKRFNSMVKMRAIRYLIRQIAAGFREGVENVYYYSKAIGGSFAPAMNEAAASLKYMKNSIGAAVAPLIQSLVPVLKTVVNWFVTAVNWINQFFALLRGQDTWTRALVTDTDAFEDKTKAAGAAAKEMKDLLADFDELNIIQSASGGGGGGSSSSVAEDYENMFEEVNKYDEKIRSLVDFVNSNLESAAHFAELAGAAILGWKVSQAFAGLIGTLGSLVAGGAALVISWSLTEMFDRQYVKTGETGWLVADLLTNAVGATLAGRIVGKVLGGGAGLITAGIELVVSGAISVGIAMSQDKNADADLLQSIGLAKAAIGEALTAAGFWVVTGSAAGGIAGAALGAAMFTLVAGVTIVAAQLEDAHEAARKAFAKTGEGGIDLDTYFAALQDELNRYTEGHPLVISAFSKAEGVRTDLAEAFGTISSLSAIVRGDGKLTMEEAQEFHNAWETVFSSFDRLQEIAFDTLFANLDEALMSSNNLIRQNARETRISLLMVNEQMTEAAAEMQVEMESLAAKIGNGSATQEEILRYFDLLDQMYQATNTTSQRFDEIISEGKRIDFKDEAGLKTYFQRVKELQDEQNAIIDEDLRAGLRELEDVRGQSRMLLAAGRIDQTTYKFWNDTFDKVEYTIRSTAAQRKADVKEVVRKSYAGVLEQAFAGLNGEDLKKPDGSIDMLRAFEYAGTYIKPIIDSAKEAGLDVGKEFVEMFNQNAAEMIMGIQHSPVVDLIQRYLTDDLDIEEILPSRPFAETISSMAEELKNTLDFGEREPVTAPTIDTTEFDSSLTTMAKNTHDYVTYINSLLSSINAAQPIGAYLPGGTPVRVPQLKASGGFVRSGDLVMANENGNFEMMGRMGNQPVVANNQQIVSGITQGVSQANGGVESRLNTIEGLLQQVLRKEFVARAVPTSDWGAHQAKSAEKYSLVTG